ncbi:MAG: hypothetical protein NDI73_02730 [Desulfuromonadales bacterium]|nr:hypothetical protein [Desulfuromonadales bacterium]
MKKLHKILLGTIALGLFSANLAMATPSTQIWIPSTDIQKFGTFHLGLDNYQRSKEDDNGERLHVYDFGLTAGVLPYEKIQMEVGFDLITNGTDADDRPLYFNAKLGTPEGALFEGSPALAAGGFSFGTDSELTDYNIVYGLVAKTFPVIGRLSAGYYVGNDDLLVDADGDEDNDGVLLSWDRTISEISDKLWAAVDYQGGDNSFGALSFGVAWAFSPNVSVIVGYDIYNEDQTGGENTYTTQLDINF